MWNGLAYAGVPTWTLVARYHRYHVWVRTITQRRNAKQHNGGRHQRDAWASREQLPLLRLRASSRAAEGITLKNIAKDGNRQLLRKKN